MLPAPGKRRAVRFTFVIAVLSVFGLGWLPLFDGPGYEIALAAGAIVPAAVAVATALERSDLRPSPLAAVERGLLNGAAFAAAAFATTLIHGLRTGFCDLGGGARMFALGPGIGALLAGLWGAVAGEIALRASKPWRRRGLAIGAALALPVGSALWSVARFYGSPIVFAYDPFVGFFSGTLYDTVIDASRLVTYRAGSAATIAAAVLFALHLGRDAAGALRWRRRGDGPAEAPPSLVWTGAGAILLTASLAHAASGSAMSHSQSAASIREILGHERRGARCDVVYPGTISETEIALFTADCDAHVAALERWFEASGPDRIRVFLFADGHQKAELMGAAETQVAKPWRKEVYVQAAPYPHPVIGHELAHAVAGAFGRGPFRVGADWGGLVPNPGLIEGVAVAASPREGDLSSADWAKAMKDLKLLPRLGDLFALGFLSKNAGLAYTVSGAFVEHVRAVYGAGVVRGWYGGKPLPELTGKSWAGLEEEFHAALDRLVLSDAARIQAKARFDRPGVFGRRCPHRVDECRGRAEGLRGAGDLDAALAELATIRDLDPGDFMSRLNAIRIRLQKTRDLAAAREELARFAADETAPRRERDRAIEDLGDLALSDPKTPGNEAAERFRDVMTRTVDEDVIRTLEVKAFAAESRVGALGETYGAWRGASIARRAVAELLVGAPGYGQDRTQAAELFGLWAREAPDDGLPHYLMARHFMGAERYDLAAERLDRALSLRLDLRRVRAEALRLRLICACALGDAPRVGSAYDALRAHEGAPEARLEAARGLALRCAPDVRSPQMP